MQSDCNGMKRLCNFKEKLRITRKELVEALRPLKAEYSYIKLNAKTEVLQTWYDKLIVGQQSLQRRNFNRKYHRGKINNSS